MGNAPVSGNGSGTTTTTNGNAPPQGIAKPRQSGGPQIYFSSAGYTQIENTGTCGNNNAILQIDLSAASNTSVSVYYSTSDGSAKAGIDYTAENNIPVTFAPGQTQQNISIPILDDGNDETVSLESFNVTLSNPSGGTLGTPYTATVNIPEDAQQSATDTLQWNPCPGSNDYASDPTNWYDQQLGMNLSKGQPGPGASSPIVFDANPNDTPHSNAPITWDNSFTVASITLNQYTNTQTVDAELATSGYNDKDIGVSNFVVAFAAADADLNLKAGQDVMGNFDWENVGNVFVNGATVTIGNGAGLSQSTEVPVTINSGTVSIGPSTATATSTFQLTKAAANITVNGGMLYFHEPQAAAYLVTNNAKGAQIINNGITYLVGTGYGGAKATIDAPFENHGTLNANTAGTWYFHAADNAGNDLSMDKGEILLMEGVSITCQHAYTQTGGTLEVGDNTTVNFWCELGSENFNGGKIVFSLPTDFGILEVAKVVFNGVEIDMRIDGTNGNSDRISALTNSTTIKGNSKLVVTAMNPVQKGINWILIQPDPGDTITGDFLAANITLPPNVKESAGALPNEWGCNS